MPLVGVANAGYVMRKLFAIMKGEYMREIKSLDDFRELKDRGMGYILITDSTGNVLHEISCGYVTERNFTIKVLENECKQGNYYLVDDLDSALEKFNADKCSKCLA